MVYGLRYEVEGEDKLCAVAELVFRHYDLGADAALPLSGRQLRDTASTPNLRVPRRGVGRHLLYFSREFD